MPRNAKRDITIYQYFRPVTSSPSNNDKTWLTWVLGNQLSLPELHHATHPSPYRWHLPWVHPLLHHLNPQRQRLPQQCQPLQEHWWTNSCPDALRLASNRLLLHRPRSQQQRCPRPSQAHVRMYLHLCQCHRRPSLHNSPRSPWNQRTHPEYRFWKQLDGFLITRVEPHQFPFDLRLADRLDGDLKKMKLKRNDALAGPMKDHVTQKNIGLNLTDFQPRKRDSGSQIDSFTYRCGYSGMVLG
jgi:hypothetical protein